MKTMMRTIPQSDLRGHIMWGMIKRDGVDGYFTRHKLLPKRPAMKGHK